MIDTEVLIGAFHQSLEMANKGTNWSEKSEKHVLQTGKRKKCKLHCQSFAIY